MGGGQKIVCSLRSQNLSPLNLKTVAPPLRIGNNKMKASIDDIISMLSVVDENNLWNSLPTFCAASRSRVPDIPDELSDIAAIRYELKQVREHLECLTLKFMSAGVSESARTDEKHTADDLSTPLNGNSCSSTLCLKKSSHL